MRHQDALQLPHDFGPITFFYPDPGVRNFYLDPGARNLLGVSRRTTTIKCHPAIVLSPQVAVRW